MLNRVNEGAKMTFMVWRNRSLGVNVKRVMFKSKFKKSSIFQTLNEIKQNCKHPDVLYFENFWVRN